MCVRDYSYPVRTMNIVCVKLTKAKRLYPVRTMNIVCFKCNESEEIMSCTYYVHFVFEV